jgi:hypothetical protein
MSKRTPEADVNVTTLTTEQLVARHEVAKQKCNEPLEDEGGWTDYIPVVAGWNLITGESADRDERAQAAAEIRAAWCAIATEARNELLRRDVTEVERAKGVVQRKAVGTFGPGAALGPTPADPGEAPGFRGTVVSDVGSALEKLNPIYWLGRIYDGTMDAVGLGDAQTPVERVLGLLRLLLMLAAALGGLYVLKQLLTTALGFGAKTTETAVKALPTIAQVAR